LSNIHAGNHLTPDVSIW